MKCTAAFSPIQCSVCTIFSLLCFPLFTLITKVECHFCSRIFLLSEIPFSYFLFGDYTLHSTNQKHLWSLHFVLSLLAPSNIHFLFITISFSLVLLWRKKYGPKKCMLKICSRFSGQREKKWSKRIRHNVAMKVLKVFVQHNFRGGKMVPSTAMASLNGF